MHVIDELVPVVPAATHDAMTAETPRRKRGRPLEMQPDEVLLRIRKLAEQDALFRVHLQHPALYARARRLFGTWADAIRLAGFDHSSALAEARRRAVEARRRRYGSSTGLS
jgi:hypothetical protein